MGSYYDKLKTQMDEYNHQKNSQSCNLPASFPPYYMDVDDDIVNPHLRRYPDSTQKENCCCCCCKCIPCICPPQPPPVTCPPPTLPNESPICEQRRAAFQATNPHLRFDLNIVYQFFNNQVTFAGATQQCNALPGYTLITLPELIAISNDFNTAGLCQMLLWTTNNGVPTLAYFVPGSPTPIIPVPTPSLSCLAYGICAGPIE